MSLDNRLIVIASLNALVFLLFIWDKLMAKFRKRRISESALLLGAAVGGCVGGLLAMLIARHKTSDRSFLWKFVVCFVLGIATNVFLLRW